MRRKGLVLIVGLVSAGCGVESPLPVGQAAYSVIPVSTPPVGMDSYVIGPLDTVSVNVFEEPQLSVSEAQVDPGGRLALPLLGAVSVQGRTADALSEEIERLLSTYLVDPHVSVSVNSITQRVIVEGNVGKPGVYDIRGNSSLLEALAMAESPTNRADLDEIFVFREIDGQTQGARFDLRRIRAGIDADPAIFAGDRIVVGLNELGAAWQDYFGSPVFNVFRVF